MVGHSAPLFLSTLMSSCVSYKLTPFAFLSIISSYRAFKLLDAKVVLLLLALSVGDDVDRGDDDGDDDQDGHAAHQQHRHPTH